MESTTNPVWSENDDRGRSEEHTSELQSPCNLVCRLLLEKKNCESMERLDQAFEAARTFKPLSQAAISKLLAKTGQAAMTGKYEPFKTSAQFVGTAHHLDG